MVFACASVSIIVIIRRFIKAREIFESGVMGELMFIRARYGHGGRIGYDKEWRADPKLSGGGELIDQGIHLIDLAGWFLGEFKKIDGHAETYFWKMPVDDNAFLDLRNAEKSDGVAARQLHGMEKSFFVRDLRSRRETAHRRTRRQLRRRKTVSLPDETGNGNSRTRKFMNFPARTNRGEIEMAEFEE